MLHKAERRTATTKTVRETEAEAVAFVVGKTIGLETGRASADYIHLYDGNAALPAHRELRSDPEDLRCHSRRNRKNSAEETDEEPEPTLTQAS